MDEREKKFISYCLNKKLLTKKRLQEIMTERAAEISKVGLNVCISRELGLDDEKMPKAMKTLINVKKSKKDTVMNIQSTRERVREKKENRGVEDVTKNLVSPVEMDKESADPKRIGNYIIQEHIGTGGMGKIYKAFNPHLDRCVAIKVLMAPEMGGLEYKERFLREARLSAQLNHPNIIHVYDVGVDKGLYYIVMDYISGQTLESLIGKKEISPRWAVQQMAIIAEALSFAHQKGIIHRDIKPSNVMITSDDTPILMDFGIARGVEDKEGKMTKTGQLIGTPGYMSPEQAKGIKVDSRSDIYSFGAMFYELLSGRPVVDVTNVMAILHHVIYKETIPLSQIIPSISRDVETICMKCLEKDPNKRYESMGQLAEDLRKFLAGENISAKPMGFYGRLRKRLRRYKYAVVTFILILSFFISAIPVFRFLDSKRKIDLSITNAENALNQGSYKEAWRNFQDVMKIENNNEKGREGIERVQQQLFLKAQESLKINDYRGARMSYQIILEMNMENKTAREALRSLEKDIENMMKEAEQKRMEGKWSEGKNIYESIIKSDPDNREAKECLEKLRRAWAMTYYQKAMEIYNNPQLKRTDLQECIGLLTDAIGKDNYFTEALFERGRIYQLLSHTERSVEDYKKCIELDPTMFPPKYYLAKIEFEKSDKLPQKEHGSVQVYETLLSAYYDYFIEHKKILEIRTDKGINIENYYKALDICKKIEESHPFFSEVHFLKANIYEDISWSLFESKNKEDEAGKALDQALACVNRGLETDPKNGEGYFQRGNIYLALYEFEYALQDYEKALRLGFSTYLLYYNMSFCLFGLKHYEEAQESIMIALNRLINIEVHKDRDRYVWLLRFLLSCCYFMQGDNKIALEELDNSLKPDIKVPYRPAHDMMVYIKYIRSLYLCYLYRDDEARRGLEECEKDSEKLIWTTQLKKYKQVINFDRVLSGSLDPFIVSVDVKNICNSSVPLIFREMSEFQELKKYFSYFHINFSIVLSAVVEKLNQDSDQDSRLLILSQKAGLTYQVKTILLCTLSGLTYLWNKRVLNLKSKLSYKLYYRRAIYFYLMRDFENALKDLEHALDLISNSMKIHYATAALLSIESGKDSSYKEKAIYHLKRAIELGWGHKDYTRIDPDFISISKNPEFLALLNMTPKKLIPELMEESVNEVDILLNKGNIKSAIRLLKPYKNSTDENVQSLIMKVEKRFCSSLCQKIKEIIGKQDQEEQVIDQVLDEANLFLDHNAQNKVRRAIAEYFTAQGEVLEQKNEYKAAMEKYDFALDYDAQYWIAYAKKGDICGKEEKYSEAALNWEEALLFCPVPDSTEKLQQKINQIRKEK